MGQLFRISGFLAYVLMIFLNAFVDLGHKIIIQNTLFKTYDGECGLALMWLLGIACKPLMHLRKRIMA
ncbi:hypothetical protein G3480_20685, partial [Thiorhodococcus mannitoliphagus]